MRAADKFGQILLIILFLVICIPFYIGISYGDPVDKKAKVIECFINEDNNKFETVLEVDGEIIFKNDKVFYYKVRDKVNQEIDITIKENKLNNKIIELKE